MWLDFVGEAAAVEYGTFADGYEAGYKSGKASCGAAVMKARAIARDAGFREGREEVRVDLAKAKAEAWDNGYQAGLKSSSEALRTKSWSAGYQSAIAAMDRGVDRVRDPDNPYE